MSGERGQASVELVAALPVVVVLALVLFQLLALGHAKTQAATAAEAGALALAAGKDPAAAARRALPAWPARRMRVRARGGAVSVRLLAASPLRRLERVLTVEATAHAEGP